MFSCLTYFNPIKNIIKLAEEPGVAPGKKFEKNV